MAKIRVYELARELQIESKLLMNTLKTIGIAVASHQSTLTDEQIAQVKAAIKGEAPPASAGSAGAGASATKKKTVIRRRRRAGSEETPPPAEEAAPAEAGGAASAEQPEAKAAKTAETSEPATLQSTESTAEDAGVAVETADSSAEVPGGTASESGDSKPAAEAATAEEPAAAKPKRRQAAGATIVRKATPEEVEKSKAEQQARRKNRREDSKGIKYTGYSNERGESKGDQSSVPGAQAADLEAELNQTGRRSKEKRKTVADDEAAAAKKLALQKQKRSGNVNTRQLLSAIDPMDDDGEAPAESAGKQKTVYTPNASQRRRDLKRRKDLKKTEITTARASYRVVQMGEEITVGELAKQLKVKGAELIKKLMGQGVMATINQSIDFDTASLIASEYSFEVKSNLKSIQDILAAKAPTSSGEEGGEVRPPIVTVMGHVDHGKTSILDAIRKADVASGEAGGITQHIGAYSVNRNDSRIAFLDTPGHEAFSAMRARGANVTDIVVLVVAADDGVMPQTVEAIAHSKDAGVPLIVAINKIDKEAKNFERIYTELAEHGVQAEEWGGETQFIKCSAHTREGLEELLDAINLQAEVLELKTSSNRPAEGVVVEANLDASRGTCATIMVKHGTMRIGDYVVAGTKYGKVRAMLDHTGKSVDEAAPATPVEILGLSDVPQAGDQVNVVADEKTAREAAEWRIENQSNQTAKSSAQSLEDLLGKMQQAETPELPIIVKGDTQGSVEAVCESIMKLNSDRVRNKIIHKAAGGISESDLTLGEASGAVILGFNVRAARGLDDEAEKRGLNLEYYSVIYDLVDAVKNLMVGKLPPVREEVVIGRAEVRQPISVPKVGTVAGSAVIDGRITRNSALRLIRDDIVIYDGKVGSLRRFKDDVKEVKSGYECGISFEGYNDIKPGDMIEAYEIKESQATL